MISSCCNCHIQVETRGSTWSEMPIGWGCLFGSLAACSEDCARSFAENESSFGYLPDGMFDPLGAQPIAPPQQQE